ncbi:hypothetical protein [Methylobacterium sp. Leaf89]|uniref:hypothetical protein n=1 Tax=Methylobacterium sp. Leaf89 TaxID=1736245 RepID=UPI0006F4EA80|nr:hypothetical protein [Methylobacterium sp. Leaf89]KQO67846.1 hypothetical protein ASF18_04960 [Methylobacterium sp. Leaf89]
MKAVTLALASTFALTTIAFAAGSGPGSANNAPGQEMQQNGSQYGSPGASGYAPGQEKGATTGSTSHSGMGSHETGASTASGSTGMKSGAGSR